MFILNEIYIIPNTNAIVIIISTTFLCLNLLDKLDVICNDIFNGLPAEIEARQKQYEYYKDKLLTFKELVNEV